MKYLIPDISVPRLGFAAFYNRLILRFAFILLMLATVALAVQMLHEEKIRSYQNYQHSFQKTQAEIIAKLRHPAGQLALMNPAVEKIVPPLHPLLLPFGSLDFDDLYKARQAVEMTGCSVLYTNNSALCVAIGNNPYAGGFVYLVGSTQSIALQGRERGQLDLQQVHRVRVKLQMRGQEWTWLAPYERESAKHGHLIGFVSAGENLEKETRPVRDFRGWMWQERNCKDNNCTIYFSVRLPVEPLAEALFQERPTIWPPADLDKILLQIQVFEPNKSEAVFDSNQNMSTAPFSLADLKLTLQEGEILSVRKTHEVFRLAGQKTNELSSPWLTRLIHALPTENFPKSLEKLDVVTTPLADYQVVLTGQFSSVDRNLGIVATRVSWFVLAMLGAIALAWAIIELSFIRRVARLTKRAATVSHNMPDEQTALRQLNFTDLRGADEVGILASSLDDLLQRVKTDVLREQVRAQQERDMWHSVGHEIMSPLQSLMVLHAKPEDESHRYVQRMQQAVLVLYGQASPSEALQAANLQVNSLELCQFLQHIADNAHYIGIEHVTFITNGLSKLMVAADEFSLEDVISHILRNADRFRIPETSIQIELKQIEPWAQIRIFNQGKTIDPHLLDQIFEYGVSEQKQNHHEQRGQGLFVARTYMSKMGGSIRAENQQDGVCMVLELLLR